MNLFVYGTLRKGARTRMSRYLASASVPIGQGRTRGALFQMNGYPAMILRSHVDQWVTGEVFRLSDPASTLVVLDAYEGDEYKLCRIKVCLGDGRVITASAYVYGGSIAGKRLIPSGDYATIHN